MSDKSLKKRYKDLLYYEGYGLEFQRLDEFGNIVVLNDFEVKRLTRKFISLLQREILGLENVAEVSASFKDEILSSLEQIQDQLT
jgi:hypothetical protein